MPHSSPERPRVYCAGPLFNRAERDEMTAIADALCTAGYRVYLPHRDGMEFRLIHHVLIERGWPAARAAHFLHEAIFALDVYQLVIECQCVVWNLNGRTPDEGAVSEAAIAWTLGKPLVAYKDDVRSLIAGRVNPLLVGLVEFETVEEIEAIPRALDQALMGAAPAGTPADAVPPKLERAVRDGRTLWQAMTERGAHLNDERIAGVVADLFAPRGAVRPEPSSNGDRAASVASRSLFGMGVDRREPPAERARGLTKPRPQPPDSQFPGLTPQ